MATFKISNLMVCGIKELHNISVLPTPEAIVQQVALEMAAFNGNYRLNPAFLLFSGVVGERAHVYPGMFHADRSDDYGTALATYITANNLGTVTASQPAKNHSGNMMQAWLWAPRWEALEDIWRASRPSILTPSPSIETTTFNY